MTDYNDGSWHGWNGGECPVHLETVVEAVCYEDDAFIRIISQAGFCSWSPPYIIAFRVVNEHREPQECWVCKKSHFARWSRPSANQLDEYIHVREVME